jgi:hypothetical protein
MDLTDLKELDSLKADEYGRISKKNKKDKIDILDFYQDLNLDTTYTSANSASSNSIKPYQLFPFFKTVIVDVLPLYTEALFERYYGMSVEDLIELERKDKVAIRLPGIYTDYKDVENDYLDPILSRRPPSTFLINLKYGMLINNKISEEISEMENFFKNKEDFDFGNNLSMEMGMVDPLVITSSDIVTGNRPFLSNLNNDSYIKFTQNNFLKLNYTGYGNVNNFLKELLNVGHGRLDWAFTYSSAYTSFLADPILNSLNGTHMVNYNMKEILNDLIIRTSNDKLNKELLKKSNEILCYDIGKTLSEEISTPLPLTMQDSLDLDFDGATNALKSLEKVIDGKNRNEIIELSIALKNELFEAGQIVEGMRGATERDTTKITNITTTISLLGAGAGYLSGDPHFQPILNAIPLVSGGLSSIARTETLQKVIGRVVKSNKNDHVLYLYNNFKKVPITSNIDKIEILKSKKDFKDDLSKKYEYYEYIYRNIPIIRVLIDITSRLIVGKGLKLEYTGDETVPNSKIIEFLTRWQKENLPNEIIVMQNKYLLLYGKSYFLTSVVNKGRKKDLKLKPVHPKFIRPIYKNFLLKGYKILNEEGKIEFIKKDLIMSLDNSSKNISFVEKYIFLLDEIYPRITNKEIRPKLFYDVLLDNLDKASELTENDYNKSKKILLDTFKIAQYLENNVYSTIILITLGDLNRKYNKYAEAIEYYEKAQDFLEGKVYSVIMENLEKDLVYKILETLKLI